MRNTRDTITLFDVKFEKYIEAAQIKSRIIELAAVMNSELRDSNPIFLCILNGAFFFASDLMKELDFEYEISFIKVASYHKDASTGILNSLIGMDEDLSGRNVIIIEDIVDTGLTLSRVIADLKKLNPATIQVATLLMKPDALKHSVEVKYVGFEVKNLFLVGYGLDFDRKGRHYKDIYVAAQTDK